MAQADSVPTPASPALLAVRARIDAVDAELVALIARRVALVAEAAALKTSRLAVAAPDRVAAVLALARSRAQACAAPVAVVEATVRALVDACIAYELERHQQLSGQEALALRDARPGGTGTSR